MALYDTSTALRWTLSKLSIHKSCNVGRDFSVLNSLQLQYFKIQYLHHGVALGDTPHIGECITSPNGLLTSSRSSSFSSCMLGALHAFTKNRLGNNLQPVLTHTMTISTNQQITPAFSIEPLTYQQAKAMLEQAFAINSNTMSNEDARVVLFNIARIQENVVDYTFSVENLWHLLESDPRFGSYELKFPRRPVALTMLISMIKMKKTLFTKLFPDQYYGSWNHDEIFKNRMIGNINHVHG